VTNREFCLTRRKSEIPAFVRVLKALPQARLDYRPDPRARAAGDLAGVIVAEEAALVTLLDVGEVLWKEEPTTATVEEMVASFEASAAAANERIARMAEADWDKKVRFLLGGDAPPWEDAVSEFVWGFLFDQVHHRGQLSTYLRPMGGKVPSIYGPSADSGQ
jgi:uncharacterized damage-inducible protein DinB